jgi:hypothetical protein
VGKVIYGLFVVMLDFLVVGIAYDVELGSLVCAAPDAVTGGSGLMLLLMQSLGSGFMLPLIQSLDSGLMLLLIQSLGSGLMLLLIQSLDSGLIEELKALVMVAGVINIAIVRVYDALSASLGFAEGADVALVILFVLRKKPFIITEIVASDALARRVVFKGSALPAKLLGSFLGDEVLRKLAIGVDVQRHIFLGGVGAIFGD